MHALFFVLAVACAGLFLATLAISRHVQRSRRRAAAPLTAQRSGVLSSSAPSAPAPPSTGSVSTGRLIHSKQLQISL